MKMRGEERKEVELKQGERRRRPVNESQCLFKYSWHRMINDHLSVNNSFISQETRVTLRYTLKFLCRKQPSSPTYTCSNPFNLKSYHSSYFFYLLHYKTCQIYMYYRE